MGDKFDDDSFRKTLQELDHLMVDPGPLPTVENSERSAVSLEEISELLKQGRAEQIQAEKKAQRWQIAGFIVGVLTLLATLIIGAISISLQMSPQPQNTQLPQSASASVPVTSENLDG